MNLTQLTETIQAYYDRSGIEEKADVKLKDGAGAHLTIEVHTGKLLTYAHLTQVSSIVWPFITAGVSHEVVNVVLDGQLKEQKITPDGFDMKVSVEPANSLPDPNTSVTMPGVNESGEIVPMPLSKKRK
jgi:hypothetical protein